MILICVRIVWRQQRVFKTIKEQVRKVIQYSQDIPDPKVDELMDKWLEAKRDFIEVFDGNLIYEIPNVSFHLTREDIERRVNELINYIKYTYENSTPLEPYILANIEGFQDNLVQHTYQSRRKCIPAGSKLVKSFKHFAQGKMLDDIQTRASQIIQENVITGTLCLSVHPLDYLSSSENTYHWRSCHALDGEYRAGNLSYMLDKSTVICYLKGSDNVKLPMFPEDVKWNNKKWRVLLHVSDNWDLIFAGRQYPFSSEQGIEILRSYFLTQIRKDPWNYCTWTDPVIAEVPDSYGRAYDLNSHYVAIRGNLHELRNIVVDCENPLHFNDVLKSSYYKPHYTALNNRPWFREPISTVHVGASCNCLRCGLSPIEVSETFMCKECDMEYGEFNSEIYTICDCCGRRIYIEDAVYVGEDEVCEDCARTECFFCEECEEVHYNDDKIYLEEEDRYICTQCANDM